MDNVITKDMYLAAALLAYGSTILKVDRSDPKRQYFHFDRLPTQVQVDGLSGISETRISSLEEIQSHFLAHKLWLPPTYVACLRSVKSYLYQEGPHVHGR